MKSSFLTSCIVCLWLRVSAMTTPDFLSEDELLPFVGPMPIAAFFAWEDGTTTSFYDFCESSPCRNNATCQQTDSDGFRCLCPPPWMDGVKQITLTGFLCEQRTIGITGPTIEDIAPLFGPVAGGTTLTLTGQHFTKFIPYSIHIGSLPPAQVLDTEKFSKDDNTAFFVTPQVNETDAGMTAQMSVEFTSGLVKQSPFSFTYKGNPSIGDIYPLDHIISGGTTLTVAGSNMDAVANPILEITQIYTYYTTTNHQSKNITHYNSLCSLNSSESMHCPLPTLTLPDQYAPCSANVNNTEGSDCTQIPSSVGNSTLEFIVGFQLDGYDKYEDLSEALPDKVLSFYGSPTFEILDDILVFKPEVTQTISLKGSGMLTGATIADYTVRLGSSRCVIHEMQHNRLSCAPPADRPQFQEKDENHCGEKLHAILILVGYSENFVGCLKYEFTKQLSVLAIVLIACGCVIFVTVVALVLVVWRCRKPRATKRAKHPTLHGATGQKLAYDYDDGHTAKADDFEQPESTSFLTGRHSDETMAAHQDANSVDQRDKTGGRSVNIGSFGGMQIPGQPKRVNEYEDYTNQVFIDESSGSSRPGQDVYQDDYLNPVPRDVPQREYRDPVADRPENFDEESYTKLLKISNRETVDPLSSSTSLENQYDVVRKDEDMGSHHHGYNFYNKRGRPGSFTHPVNEDTVELGNLGSSRQGTDLLYENAPVHSYNKKSTH